MVGSSSERVTIVGGGAAGAECAARLRMADFAGEITILSADVHPPYELPSLSKGYLSGASGYDEVLLRPVSAYTEHDIDLQLNTRVKSIDTARHEVRLDDGRVLSYSKLVLATGGRPRPLLVPGAADSAHVFYLRTLNDADRLRSVITPTSSIAVIGGGYLGLEVASVARSMGAAVTVLEGLPRLLSRVTSPPVSEFFARLHRTEGVDLRLEAKVERIEDTPDGRVTIHLGDDAPIRADLVFASIGLLPSVQLGIAAGLEAENGIRVDEYGQTSVPDVYAAGDCTSHPDAQDGGFRRLESLPNAMETAATVAASIVGNPAPYVAVPWFWSEQYDVKLQTVGVYKQGDDAVVRGDERSGEPFSVFYLRGGEVRAADVISSPRDFAAAKTLVARRVAASAADLADRRVPLKALLRATAAVPSA
ncbi:hypothetical protein F8568_031615 [Actinomadura sp. LD22]|uniref:Pyridine nucleotide-disulfide oxidoreductase n=1 Tax=Actinomadura physcomitrii TaxID=2650748 RepID=A0A6I4MIW9_9ACTN|nr:FAD-dependent oxidoreductase [Actinomadura physcomitrii]MWA04840.1 hypothetical protein [Actinomadura physcomitrii]